MTPDPIRIRACTTLAEFGRCVELQRLLWGSSDRDLVPKEIYVVAVKVGGHLLGAFDGADMIGFALASPGYRPGQSYLYSLMTAVLPSYEQSDVQRRLRLEQRDHALARGFDLVEWSFDPLAVEEAEFAIERLGAVGRRLERGHYADTTVAGPAAGLPLRLVAEWWLRTPRVEAALKGPRAGPLAPGVQVHVPIASGNGKKADPAAVQGIYATVEEQLGRWLKQGYAVVGFERSQDRGTYLLAPFTP
jgi:predicted GNAT superfamily acetyltransferase